MTETNLILGIISLFVVYLIIAGAVSRIKQKAYNKGWDDAYERVGCRLQDFRFFIKDNQELKNFLWIAAYKCRQNKKLTLNQTRDVLEELGNTDLEELDLKTRSYYLNR